ncbi:hypothetical protein DACRYDRAFT_114292 [Dacryopinax primogenitus]|uniref:Checkpoint protein n=1 Tax=Dacryopinax primogenitus (strain DJM 731) TaxID=1858805 RepID=M5GE13_DACPD|nr:uncharacterized protein DACRYDRAFT_114292 [Dacryopinax primogenitus]EJU04992.1 hypothetical protein DACRYDRAFT_114292 [Dacryopinax primogenitus]
MKFRAEVSNVKYFYQVVQSVEKVAKKCIIRLSPESIEIICAEGNEEGIQVWSKINKACLYPETLFTGYRVQSNADNIICADIVTDSLVSVLRDLATTGKSGTRDTVMKLAKRNDQAVFVFETKDHVHVVIRSLGQMRGAVEKMKVLDDKIMFSANNRGELILSAETKDKDNSIRTTWVNLTHPTIEAGEGAPPRDPPDPEKHFGATMSAASLLKFMSTATINKTTCIACICENHCLIMYVYIGDPSDSNGILTFYLPARLSGDDD